jgi:hypothetical protein
MGPLLAPAVWWGNDLGAPRGEGPADRLDLENGIVEAPADRLADLRLEHEPRRTELEVTPSMDRPVVDRPGGAPHPQTSRRRRSLSETTTPSA